MSFPAHRLSNRLLTVLTVVLFSAACMTAAEHSPTLDHTIANTPKGEAVPVILFLDQRLSMDEVYPVARSLPMSERRQYVVDALQRRFNEMSPRVMERLAAYEKSGGVTLLRPLWIINAIRVWATEDVLRDVDRNFSEVTYIAADQRQENTLDWGYLEIGAPQVWSEIGADGSGVIVGHKDAGIDWDHPGFAGHVWVNPGEDLNGNGSIDNDEINNVDDDGNGYVDDFRGWNFDANTNDVSDDPSPYAGGHGTKTGSVISANTTPCGTISVAPGAKLMVLRGFWFQGAFIEASQYAIEKGAHVISSSVSFKQENCSESIQDCPNHVAHRWVCEMELAAGIIHSNSTGNRHAYNPLPFSAATPSNCPPPVIMPGQPQHGGVSSIVSVAAYYPGRVYFSGSGRGPAAWSRNDVCINPRVPFCAPEGFPNAYPEEFEDYPWENGAFPGLLRPDITSPSNAASLSPGGGCSSISGTSGAAPHAGGALALIYSAFPGITPEDAYVLLVSTAQDTGDAGPDNMWGFGMLRVFRACSTGVANRAMVVGTVQDYNGQPLAGVRVSLDGSQTVYTSTGGLYEISADPGTHALVFEKWGYADATETVVLTPMETETHDVTLPAAAAATVSGDVTYGGQALYGMPVYIPEADMTVYTVESGYFLAAPLFAGTYDFIVGALPLEADTVTVTVLPGDNTVNFGLEYSPRALPSGPDGYGYRIWDGYDMAGISYDWIEVMPSQGGQGIQISPAGDGCTTVTLPFAVRLYGQEYTTVSICTNGLVLMGAASTNLWGPHPIPRPEAPNGFVAPFYYDWNPTLSGEMAYQIDAANHRVVIEWYNMSAYLFSGDQSPIRASFQVIINQTGFPQTPTGDSRILFQYKRVIGRFEGVVGIENQDGSDGIQYEYMMFQDPHGTPIDSGSVLLITTDTLMSADEGGRALPTEFSLEPNYPNPFNPSTTFSWNVPRASDVRLALYNVLGREAAVVFEGRCEAGTHMRTFDATALSTGVYFARLEANGQTVAARKVLLMK